jgi:hypothetical protein
MTRKGKQNQKRKKHVECKVKTQKISKNTALLLVMVTTAVNRSSKKLMFIMKVAIVISNLELQCL